MKKAELKRLLFEIERIASRQNRASDAKKYLVWDAIKIAGLLANAGFLDAEKPGKKPSDGQQIC